MPSCTEHVKFGTQSDAETAYQLVAGVAQLEVWRRRRELVDELRDGVGQPGVFVALQVRFEVVFSVALIDL